MKTIYCKLFFLFLIIILFLSITTKTYAQTCPAGFPNYCGSGCQSGYVCQLTTITPTERYCECVRFSQGDSGPFGSIKSPISAGCQGPGCGLIMLLNNILRLIFVLAGIYTMIRILTAGFKFISAGANPEKISEAQGSIWQSLIGLIIIISSIAVAGLIGLLLFGSATAILNPKIYGPQ